VAAKRAEREEQGDRHAAAFVVGALLGGAAGAAWTLFNVPRSGAETRAAIAHAVQTAGRRVGAALEAARDSLRASGERAADRLALAIDAVAGGGNAEWPGPQGALAAPVATTANGAVANGPTAAVNGEATGASGRPDGTGTGDRGELAAVALPLDPSGVEPAPAEAPAGPTH
jgi:hypothetical protein